MIELTDAGNKEKVLFSVSHIVLIRRALDSHSRVQGTDLFLDEYGWTRVAETMKEVEEKIQVFTALNNLKG